MELDGLRWRSADATDATEIASLVSSDHNRMLFGLPTSEEEIAVTIGKPGFRIPMLCLRGAEAIGVAATTRRDMRNGNVQLLCAFAEPKGSSLALAMYLRQLFWSWPFNRVHAQIPSIAGAPDHVQLLCSVGFQEEGVVRDHAVIDGRPVSVIVLGLLRRDFEAWCQTHETRLLL